MSTLINYNGIPYLIPSTGEVGWGQEVSSYLIALSDGSLSLEGGNFPLLAEVNFGPNFGVASPYFRSGLNPAATDGVLRLTNTESVMWRNAANTGNLALSIVGDQLYFAGAPIGGGTASPLTTKGDLYTFSNANARLPVGLNGEALIADSSTSTGLAWAVIGGAGGGSVVGFSFINANGISGTVATSTTTPALTLSLGAITPTSVAASGTVTGSNISGTSSGTNTGDQTITLTGDVTGSGTGSFAVTYNGVVPILKGGTGQTTANASLNALLPSQTSQTGKVLQTDGTNTSWQNFPGAGSVTSVGAVGTQGVTTNVVNPTITPTITIGLGDITPTSVAASGTVTGSNISGTATGTNTGDQTISLTGDVTGSGTGTFATTLANTSVTAGTYGSPSQMPVITVDSKGRVTAVTTLGRGISITGDGTGTAVNGIIPLVLANTGVVAGTYNNVTVNLKGLAVGGSNIAYLTGNENITITGDATGSGTTAIALTLANTSVAAGSYINPNITVDSKGRVTTISNGQFPLIGITVTNDTALGIGALINDNFPTNQNTAIGYNSLNANTAGQLNTAVGVNSLRSNTLGNLNIAVGQNALLNSVTGDFNVAIGGADTMLLNSSGDDNIAIGNNASRNNISGQRNIAIGSTALENNIASNNICIGYASGGNITTETGNIIIGNNLSTLVGVSNTTIIGGLKVDSSGLYVNGNLVAVGGTTIRGKATLSAGSVTVSSSIVTASSVIQLTHQTVGGTQGLLRVGTIVNNTSFQILSSSGTDSGIIGWTIFN